MRTASVPMFVTVAFCALVGCGGGFQQARGPSAQELLAKGDVDGALAAISYDTPSDVRAGVVRAALVKADATVTFAMVSEDDVVKKLGGLTARRLLTRHFMLQATVTTKGASLREPQLALALLAGKGKVALLDGSAEAFTSITREHYPLDKEWSEWKYEKMPSMGQSQGLADTAASTAVAVLWAPIALLTLHTETHYTPPTEDEVRAAVPLAAGLRDALAPRTTDATTTFTFVGLRPSSTEDAWNLHASVGFAGGARPIGVRVSGTMDGAASLEARAPLTFALGAAGTPSIGIDTADEQTCATPGFEQRLHRKEGPCQEVPPLPERPARVVTSGLTIPEVPVKLGAPSASEKARPAWADEGYAPDIPLDDAAAGAGPHDALVLVHCSFSGIEVPGEDTDSVSVDLHAGKQTFTRWAGRGFTMPLLDVPEKGSLTLTFYDHDTFTQPDYLATVTLARTPNGFVPKVSPRNAEVGLTCKGYARDAIEKEFLPRFVVASDALESKAATPLGVSLDSRDLHDSRAIASDSEARRSLQALAGLVGWDDPRVLALVQRYTQLHDAFEEHFRVASKQAIELGVARQKKAALAPKPATSTPEHTSSYDFSVTITGVRCNETPKSAGCTLLLETSPKVGHLFDHDLVLVLADGRTTDFGLHETKETPTAKTYLLTPKHVPPALVNEPPLALIHHKFGGVVVLPVSDAPPVPTP